MPNVITRLQAKDPSHVNGWLISVLNTIVAVLVTAQPQLDGVTGWQSAAIIFFSAASPHIQAIFTAKDAYKPSTVEAIRSSAKKAGKSEAEAEATLARSKAAKKGKAPKVAAVPAAKVVKSTKAPKATKRSAAASETS